jgi:hypothetical protein
MFCYAPFNSPTFRKFASTSASVIAHAEEEACHALKLLPDCVAATFCGLATDIKIDQRVHRTATEEH